MLTIRTSAHVCTNRHRRNFRFCASSTGVPRGDGDARSLLGGWTRLLNNEARREWLEQCWCMHMSQVRPVQFRGRP